MVERIYRCGRSEPIAGMIGCVPQTLHTWIKQHEWNMEYARRAENQHVYAFGREPLRFADKTATKNMPSSICVVTDGSGTGLARITAWPTTGNCPNMPPPSGIFP